VAGETKFEGIVDDKGLGKNWKLRYLRFNKKLLKLKGRV
jgi:hypothetical protein